MKKSVIVVTLKRICNSGFFASGQYKEHAHPLMDFAMAKSTMLHHYTSRITHHIEVSKKLLSNLINDNSDDDWEALAEAIKKHLQCSPNEERLISYGQFDDMRTVRVSGREVYMMPAIKLPQYNSGNFHIEHIDWEGS